MTKKRGDVKKNLINSFKTLAIKIPVEKITIQEIAQGAGVIRPTFYHHFQDKYQMLEYIYQSQVIDPVKELINSGMLTEAVILVFVQMQKEKEFYERVSRLEGQNSFESVVKSSLFSVILELIESQSLGKETRYTMLSHELLARYYSEFLGFIVISWIKEGMEVPPTEMASMFEYIRGHSLYEIIRDMN